MVFVDCLSYKDNQEMLIKKYYKGYYIMVFVDYHIRVIK